MKIQFIVKAWITAQQVIQSILLFERGWEQSHPISQFDFADFCWHQHGFITGQYAVWSRQQNHSVNICARYTQTLAAWSRQTTKTQTPPTAATAQIHMHRQLIVRFRGIKSGKCEDQSNFLISYTDQREIMTSHFIHLNNVTSTFHFSFFCYGGVAKLSCVCWSVV